jgi:hypothetical protein
MARVYIATRKNHFIQSNFRVDTRAGKVSRARDPVASTRWATACVRPNGVDTLGSCTAILVCVLPGALVDVRVNAWPCLAALIDPVRKTRLCLASARERAVKVLAQTVVGGIAIVSRSAGTLVDVKVGARRTSFCFGAGHGKAFSSCAVGRACLRRRRSGG